MLLTPITPGTSAWTSTTSSCRSPTPGSRRLRSRTRSSAAAPLTSSSSTARCRARSGSGNRRRNGRFAHGLQARPMSQALRQAYRHHSKIQDLPYFHQPAPHENRGHVRQPETTTGGNAAHILRIGAHRCAQDRGHQGRRQRVGNRTKAKVVKT